MLAIGDTVMTFPIIYQFILNRREGIKNNYIHIHHHSAYTGERKVEFECVSNVLISCHAIYYYYSLAMPSPVVEH